MVRADADHLVRALLPGGTAGSPLLSDLYALTLGNPFFLQEMVLAMRGRGQLELVDGEWRTYSAAPQVPMRIHDLVASRVHHLGKPAPAVLSLAAGRGASFPST